ERETGPLDNRWVAVTTASAGFRMLAVTSDNPGEATVKQGQHQEMFAGEFRFDAERRYTLHAGFASGEPFNGGWNNTDLGSATGVYRPYWKQLYLSAKPITGVEIQVGGLGIALGAFSPIVGYSDDG